MTRKLLMISDLHLTTSPPEQYRHDAMRFVQDQVKKEKPDALLILGDLTEEKDRHSAQLVNKVVDHLATFGKLAPTIVMMGNHDYHNEGHPFFAFIERMEGVMWIDKVTDGRRVGNIFDIDLDDCVFLPHTRNHKRDWDHIDWSIYDIAFAHNTFTGAASAQGHELEGIPLGVIPGRIDVYAGDVHVPQSIHNVTYIGAPYSVDFGDNYPPRIVGLEDRKAFTISMDKLPQKVLAVLDEIGELHKWKNRIFNGDVVKMRVGIDDMGQWFEVHKQCRKWIEERGAIAYKIEPVLDRQVKRRHEITKKADTSVASDEDVIRSFAKRHDVRKEELEEGIDIIRHGDDVKAGMKR